MRAKFIKGMTAGMLLGATAGMMMMPQVDRSTKRKMKKSARMIRNTADDMYDYVRNVAK